jgi:hypothetical protein
LAAASEENVCYSSYINNLGRKSTLIKVKDLLHKGLLFSRAKIEVNRRCLVSR